MIGQENRSSENAAGCNTALVCTVRRLVIGNGCLAGAQMPTTSAPKRAFTSVSSDEVGGGGGESLGSRRGWGEVIKRFEFSIFGFMTYL